MTFSLRFTAHSEVGRARKNNQDAGYASPNLLLVADGMGGAAAGDLASAVVTTVARDADERLQGEEMIRHMEKVVADANTRLAQLVTEDLTLDGMGTTFCGAMFDGLQFAITHVGDSRCYLLRDGELKQLTHDHSWVQQLIDEGRLTPKQAETHPHRSLITRVLNGQKNVAPDLELFDAAEGDRIMFCSDGLSGLISDDRIQQALGEEDLALAVEDMAAAANRAGGHDNITVVLADVVQQDDALEAEQSQLVGSALQREIPSATNSPSVASFFPVPSIGGDSVEAERYAPHTSPRRWPGVVAGVLAVLLVLGGGAWGVVAYSASRFYIAEAGGSVAIYNGLPGSLLGFELSTLSEQTSIKVSDLPRFYQRTVNNTIAASDLAGALESVEELRNLAERCVTARQQRTDQAEEPQPTPLPTSTTTPALSTGQPNYPTYLAPITPTAFEETDPEAC